MSTQLDVLRVIYGYRMTYSGHEIATARAVLAMAPVVTIETTEELTPFLEAAVRKAKADGWDEGFTTGRSRAMRHMSDEPGLPLTAPNPYRTEEGN